MAPRDHLHRLVDDLPESELERAERALEELRLAAPPYRLLENAPLDDELESADERVAVQEARRDVAAGNVIPHEEVKRRWGL